MAERGIVHWVLVAGFLALLASLFIVPFTMESGWTASGSSGGGIVVTTGAFVNYVTSTNAQGQTVVYGVTTTGTYSYYATTSQAATSQTTTAYATTSAATTTTTQPLGTAWLNIIISGWYRLLDPDGNPVETQGLTLVSGSGTPVGSFALDASYTVEGNGVDWSTLKVTCSLAGGTYQPSAADPNTPVVVNEVAKVAEWKDQTSRTGRLTQASTIDSLLASKTWDHSRKLTPSLGVACVASAKPAVGFSVAGGGDVTAVVGPVVGLAHTQWLEPTPPTPAPTPTPTPTPAPQTQPTSVTPTVAPTSTACAGGVSQGCYSTTVATTTAGSLRVVVGGGAVGGGAVGGGAVGGGGFHGAGVRALLGLPFITIEVFGAHEVSTPWYFIVASVALVVVSMALLMDRRRRKKLADALGL